MRIYNISMNSNKILYFTNIEEKIIQNERLFAHITNAPKNEYIYIYKN